MLWDRGHVVPAFAHHPQTAQSGAREVEVGSGLDSEQLFVGRGGGWLFVQQLADLLSFGTELGVGLFAG